MLSSMCELAHIPAGYDVLPQFPNACDGSSSGGMASERPCVSVGPSCSFARTATHAIYYRKKPAEARPSVGHRVFSIIDRVDCQLNQQAFRALRKGAASVVALTP